MELPTIGTVGFIIALTAFFTTQFDLKGKWALLAAFVVALAFGVAPLVSAAFPSIAPFIDVLFQTLLLTITAAGGYDLTMKVASKFAGM